MFFEKLERLLIGTGVLDQFANRCQPILTVGVRRSASLFDQLAGMFSRQVQQALQNSNGLHAASGHQSARPSTRLGPNNADLLQQPLGTAFYHADLFSGDVLVECAELSQRRSGVRADRFHRVAVDTDQM